MFCFFPIEINSVQGLEIILSRDPSSDFWSPSLLLSSDTDNDLHRDPLTLQMLHGKGSSQSPVHQ